VKERKEIIWTLFLLLGKFDIFLDAFLLTLPASISILHFPDIIQYARAVSLQKKPTTKSLDICP